MLTVNDVVKDYDAVMTSVDHLKTVWPGSKWPDGCVYIDPTRRSGFDAEVFLWARQSELAGGLEERLYRTVQEWLRADWPFEKVAFPGRDIDWPAWRAIPLEAR